MISLHPHSTGVSQWSLPPCSPRGKLLRSAWHLIRLAFVQCGRTCVTQVRALEQLPKNMVALFSISHHHHSAQVAPFNSHRLMQTPLIERISLVYIPLDDCPALGTIQEDGYNASIIQLQLGGYGDL